MALSTITRRLEADLKRGIIAYASSINAATYELLMHVEEYDRCEYFGEWDMPTMARWLQWHCHLDERTARDYVRVARALPELPLISDQFRQGKVSFSKVRAMTRVATPAIESMLVNFATYMTTQQLERTVAGYRKSGAFDEVTEANETHAARTYREYTDQEGCLIIRVSMSPDDAVMFRNALAQAKHDDYDPEIDGEDRATANERANVDAVIEMARRSMTASGHATPAATAIVIQADAEIFAKDHAEADVDPTVTSRVQNGPRLAPEAVRRLLCSSPIYGLFKNGSAPLNVGRKTRQWSWAQRIAIMARDGKCFWPGCNQAMFLDLHHIDWWSLGGETDIDRGVAGCRKHHRAIHEGGYSITRVDGAVTVYRPDGTVLPGQADPLPTPVPLDLLLEQHEIFVDDQASASLWENDRMDYSWFTALMHIEQARAEAKALATASVPTGSAEPLVTGPFEPERFS